MIDPRTGEVSFRNGIHIAPQMDVDLVYHRLLPTSTVENPWPIEGWSRHAFGQFHSHHGPFNLELVTTEDRRVTAVLLSHAHPSYERLTPLDAERHAFHESIIATDMFGQREFPWGHTFSRLNPATNRDWLSLIYVPFSGVPLHQREACRVLVEHENF